MRIQPSLNRRAFLATMTAMFGAASFLQSIGRSAVSPLLTRAIPKSGERLPVIGMGSSITFNVGNDRRARNSRTDVLRAFFDKGGGLIDSSPMYGSSEAVIGGGLGRLRPLSNIFSATKVWTWRAAAGPAQMEKSRRLWGIDSFDLLQIHNLVSWEAHLETLLAMKANKRIRYIGITTSHGRRHSEFIRIMETQPIDFVQFSYNIIDREAERRLLPMAAERDLAVIINRPFMRGALFDRFKKHPLPPWVGEFECTNWAQFFLKFIVSNPAVTCAIPATSRIDHMRENMGAARGRLPDQDMRARMLRYVSNL